MALTEAQEYILRKFAEAINKGPGIGLTGLTKISPKLNSDERAMILAELIRRGRHTTKTLDKSRGHKGAARQAYYPVPDADASPTPSPITAALAALAALKSDAARIVERAESAMTALSELSAQTAA